MIDNQLSPTPTGDLGVEMHARVVMDLRRRVYGHSARYAIDWKIHTTTINWLGDYSAGTESPVVLLSDNPVLSYYDYKDGSMHWTLPDWPVEGIELRWERTRADLIATIEESCDDLTVVAMIVAQGRLEPMETR